jgi:hypothetical protein
MTADTCRTSRYWFDLEDRFCATRDIELQLSCDSAIQVFLNDLGLIEFAAIAERIVESIR